MYEHYEPANSYSSSTADHMKKVYAWMFLALLVTAGIAFFTASVIGFSLSSGVAIGLFIAEILLVIYLSARVHKMNPAVAFVLFILYAALNGFTLSSIFLVYSLGSIVNTLLITAGMFGALSVFGYTTKKDMSGLGNFFFMALIGLLLACIINLFLASTALQWLISVVGVLVFAGITAYDTQMIKNEPFYRKHPVMGALNLYLDFINLFIHLLQFFGSKD